MRYRSPAMALFLPLVLLALQGCARFPEAADQARIQRRLTVTFQVAGRINPRHYYFIAIDTQGDPAEGPRPVVSSPWGNGWGTGRITHFVEYHLGVFTVYKMRENSDLLAWDAIGPPFEFNRPEEGAGNVIRVVLDLDTLGTNVTRINLNLITTDQIQIAPTFQGTKLYDGLGSSGNSFVNLPVDITQTFTNDQASDPEAAFDLPPQPTPDVDPRDLDLVTWTVEVRIR